MKISTFLISMLIVSLCVTGFTVYFAGLYSAYSPQYDNSQNISEFDQIGDITNITSSMSSQIQNQQQSQGGFNVLGDFLSYGWNTIKLTFTSTNTFYKILNAGFKSIPGGDPFGAMKQYKYIIGTIVIIVIIFSLVAILTGRPGL